MAKSITSVPAGTVAVPYATIEALVSALDRIALEAIKVSQGIHQITDLTRGGAPIEDDEPGPLADVVDLASRRRAKGGAA